jgi:hypothetical protein
MMQYQDEIYYCIVANDNDLTLAEIIKLHIKRAETSENKIKEFKNGFNVSYLRSSNLQANVFCFYIYIIVVYNVFIKLMQTIKQQTYKESL